MLLKKYQVFKKHKTMMRDPSGDFQLFLQNFEQSRKEIDEVFSSEDIRIMDLVTASNLEDEDVLNIFGEIEQILSGRYNEVKKKLLLIFKESDDLDKYEADEETWKQESYCDEEQQEIDEDEMEIEDHEDNLEFEYNDVNIGELKTEIDSEKKGDESQDDKIPVTVVNIKKKPKEKGAASLRYKCEHCDKDYANSNLLRYHQNGQYGQFCKVLFPDRKRKNAKKPKLRAEDQKQVNCEVCGKQMSENHLKRHIKQQHEEKKYPCDICGLMLLETSHRQHKFVHLKGKIEPFKCDQCDYTTLIKAQMKIHKQDKHGPKLFSCELCGLMFGTKRKLHSHVSTTHAGTFHCPHCDFQAINRNTFKNHVKVKHSEQFTKVKCFVCNYEASDTTQLKEHMKNLHSDISFTKESVELFSCDQCEFKSQNRKYLKEHVRAQHLGILHHCTECDFTGKTRKVVYNHFQRVHVHTIEKLSCKFCHKVLESQGSLNRHLVRAHSDQVAMYTCHLCDYRTRDKDLLQRHLSGKYGKHSGYTG